MPSSRKVARKSVSLAMELGMSKAEAAQLVQIICDEVTGILWRRSPDMDVTWLADIAAEASQIRQQAPVHTHTGACPSLVPHAAHQWWPHLDRQATCCGHGALERPGA